MPKYLTVSKEGSLTEEYYGAVAETSHDVLFVGDCEIFESFVPAVLWEEYGISAYLRGGAQQLVWHSYYLLEDALRYVNQNRDGGVGHPSLAAHATAAEQLASFVQEKGLLS